jgi:hypothetical protein
MTAGRTLSVDLWELAQGSFLKMEHQAKISRERKRIPAYFAKLS